MLSVLAAFILSGAPASEARQPVERWLSADEGLKQLTPGDWAELVQKPDSITLEGLRDATASGATPFGPTETKFTVAWKKTLDRETDVQRVLTLFRTGKRWRVQNQAACAPNQCVVVMLCGGFRPVLAITLSRQQRSMRVLVCFDCGEAWAQRFEGTAEVARVQALLGDDKAWLAVFAPLVPEGDVIRSMAARGSHWAPGPW